MISNRLNINRSIRKIIISFIKSDRLIYSIII
nr:MAG TPA: hypothetical protein [Crassvirales sp.]